MKPLARINLSSVALRRGILVFFPRACGVADVVGQIFVRLAANTANPIDAVMYEMVQYAHKVDKRSL